MSNQCKIFNFCDLENHANVDACLKRMDRYYGAMIAGDTIFFCSKCLYLCEGESRKKVFYRDHGDHLGELALGDKMNGILKGI